MNEECAVAVFNDLKHAQEAVHILQRGKFPVEQVSLVTKGLNEHPEVIDGSAMVDDSAHDAAIGAGLGAVVGLLSGVAVTAVAELGLVFLIGPIAGLAGAAVGGLLGGISGWGVHGDNVRHFETLVQQGKVLLIANGNPLELAHADRILKEIDPLELHVYAKTDSEAPEVKT